LILLAILARPALAALRPSFSLDYSSWHATHIVLVMTTSTDGTFEAVELWKGDLRVGERLVAPELIPFQNATPLSPLATVVATGCSRRSLGTNSKAASGFADGSFSEE
jgi:hypothetical protein